MSDEIDKDVLNVSEQTDAADLLTAGERLLDAGRADEAEAKLRSAVDLNPNSAHARNKLGVCYARQRRLEEAREQFRVAIQIDPHFAAAHSNIGNLYSEEGRVEEAINCYMEALRHDPDYHIAHHNLGAAYRKQGRISDAVNHLKRANRLEKEALRREARDRSNDVNWTGTLFWVAIGALVLLLLLR